MFNGASIIGNSTIDVYESTKSKTAKGSYERVYTRKYEGLIACIEHKEVETPINLSGRTLRSFYLMQVWRDKSTNLLPELKEGYRVVDTDVNKTYEIVDIQAGTLLKNKQYKLECKMIVLNDDRFTNFIKRL